MGNYLFTHYWFLTMVDIHPVSVLLSGTSRSYTASFQTDEQFHTGWQSVLKAAYGRADVRCACRGAGPKRLAVKYFEVSDAFSLARFSLSGGEHAPDCRFYSPSHSQSGLCADASGVIEQRPDGSVKIRLEIGMIERTDVAAPAAPRTTPTNRAPSAKQASMKLLGLLHYLWEEAGLNQWKPAFVGKRRASLSYWWVNNAAENVWAGHVKLVDQLLLPAFGAETREAERNRARVTGALDAKHRMLVIAPLAAYTPERAESMDRQLKIGGFHGMPIAFMQKGLWESTTRRFPNASGAWRSGHGTVAIAQIEIKQGPKGISASVIDLALMSITADFIPVDSSYERIVAEKLVTQGRAFLKQLRFTAGSDQVLPDFILTDTPREVPLEVFGRNDAQYLLRKQEKCAYYNAQYGQAGWWNWDAAASDAPSSMPPFPKRA